MKKPTQISTPDSLGPFLRKLRQKFALTQEYIAQKIGVSRPTLNKIEKGLAAPTVHQAKTLADFYNIPVEHLLTGKDSMQNSIRNALGARETLKDEATLLPTASASRPVTRAGLAEELVLYLCESLMAEPFFFEPTLKVALFLVEMEYQKKRGAPLSGLKFVKQAAGVDSEQLQVLFTDMIAKKEIVRFLPQGQKYPEYKILPLRYPRFEIFQGDELVVIEQIISTVRRLDIEDVVKLLQLIQQYKEADLYKSI